jgi:hypothetical protein
MKLKHLLLLILVFSSFTISAQTAGWRQNGTGMFPDAAPPADFQKPVWETQIGWSYSSPVLIGSKILAVSGPDILVCVNSADGKILWKKNINAKVLPKDKQENVEDFFDENETSGNTAATPLTDGKYVYTVFGNGIVACSSLKDGSVKWATHIDTEPVSMDGRSASPIFAAGKLIVHLTELFALDPATGKILWRQEDAEDSFGTPAAGKIGDVDIVVTPMGNIVRVSDGKIFAKELGELTYATPVIMGKNLYMMGMDCSVFELPDKIVDNKAEVKKVWEGEMDGDVYSSPLILDGLAYVIDNDGMLVTFDIKNKTRTELDTGLVEDETYVYASITLAGKNLYMFNLHGMGIVIKPGKKPEKVSTIIFNSGSGAAPVFSGTRMYVRCGEKLCCFDGKKAALKPEKKKE